jgi:hypothetical protein
MRDEKPEARGRKSEVGSHELNTDGTRIASAYHPCLSVAPSRFRVIRLLRGFRPRSFPTDCRMPEKRHGQKTDSYSSSTRALLPPYSIPTRVLLRSYSHSGPQNPEKTGEYREFNSPRKKFGPKQQNRHHRPPHNTASREDPIRDPANVLWPQTGRHLIAAAKVSQ